LGIWLSFGVTRLAAPSAGRLLGVSVLIEHFAAATAAHCAGRREAGVMAEALTLDNPRAWPAPGQGGASASQCPHSDLGPGRPTMAAAASPAVFRGKQQSVIAITNRTGVSRNQGRGDAPSQGNTLEP